MTKTKRKLQLSGYWWFPIRKFEFATERSLSETIEGLQNIRQAGMKSGYQTIIMVNRKNDKGEQEFVLRTATPSPNQYAYIEGQVQSEDDRVIVKGKVRIDRLLMMGIFFCTHFLFVGIASLNTLIRAKSLEAIVIGVVLLFFPLCYAWVYYRIIHYRNCHFKIFLQTILTGTTKSGLKRVE